MKAFFALAAILSIGLTACATMETAEELQSRTLTGCQRIMALEQRIGAFDGIDQQGCNCVAAAITSPTWNERAGVKNGPPIPYEEAKIIADTFGSAERSSKAFDSLRASLKPATFSALAGCQRSTK